MSYAPIVIFAYNRPKHIARVIKSLQQNPEFIDSPITVYCDGPKNAAAESDVKETRAAVHASGLPKHAVIIERSENFGLARSIITGVSEHCEKHGRVIVAEDDLVFSEVALRYLNEGLSRYEDNEQVMHLSAYMYPTRQELDETFFLSEATCWGWATWKRAWDHFEPDAGKLIGIIDEKKLRHAYDAEGTMFFYIMLQKQAKGEIDSWAIRWYASIFLNNGLSLHPRNSFVENLGFDGSGVHCNVDARFITNASDEMNTTWAQNMELSASGIAAMKEFRRTTLMSRKRRIWERIKQALRASKYH